MNSIMRRSMNSYKYLRSRISATSIPSKMFPRTLLLALAALPFSVAQISDNFENGWDQTKWATYAPDCNQVCFKIPHQAHTNSSREDRSLWIAPPPIVERNQ